MVLRAFTRWSVFSSSIVPFLRKRIVPAVLFLVVSSVSSQVSRSRRYKEPVPNAHVGVQVLREATGKPIPNAAVVFHPIVDGKDEGNLEVKTDSDGNASIDIIPVGSSVRVQVLATGFATFAEDYKLDTATREIVVNLKKPRKQISLYSENSDQDAVQTPGVQEPVRPKPRPPVAKPVPAAAPAAVPGASPAAPPPVATPPSQTPPGF